MANPYAYYVLTFDGASLMAQATATNQIVFVGAISKATAASSDEDLAGKGKSWYDGKTGEIAAVSATDSVAKIVSIFTPSGSRQDAKSVAVTARLASQSDADAVVFCAKSDPDATAILPGSTDTMADVRFPFNISINASGTVQVTPGASASIADLARFVSLHKAGDPTQGEDQTILGAKTFADGIRVDHVDLPADSQAIGVEVAANIFPQDDQEFGLGISGYAWNGVRTWELHTTEIVNDLDSGSQPIWIDSTLIPAGAGNPTLGDASHSWGFVYADKISLASTRTISIDGDTDNIQIDGSFLPETDVGGDLGSVDKEWLDLHCAGTASISRVDAGGIGKRGGSGKISLYAGIEPVVANLSLGGPGQSAFSDVYAQDFHGRMPCVVDVAAVPPVGTIFLAYVETVSTGPSVSAGETVAYSQFAAYGFSAIYYAYFIAQAGAEGWTRSGTALTLATAQYRFLSCGEARNASMFICLVMRSA